MRKLTNFFSALGAAALLLGGLAMAPQALAQDGKGGLMPDKNTCDTAKDAITVGGCVATNRRKGNCFACHQFAGLEKTTLQAGNFGPPLVAMKQRYPDKAKLRAHIWDATKANPHTSMPPFGRHGILSEKEIDLVTEWASTL